MSLTTIRIELRHSSLIGPRATSSSMKCGGDSSPLIPENYPDDDEDRDRHSSKDCDRLFSWYNFHSWCPFFGDDSRVSPYNSRISLFFFGCVHIQDLVCVSMKFLYIFFLYLCLSLVAQNMWKRNGNLDFGWSFKKPTKFGTVQYLLILLRTLCFQTFREQFNFD